MSVKENLERLRNQVYDIARGVGRDPDEITILGVTKGIEVERILEAVDAGLKLLGENRVQEAEKKIPLVDRDVEWHLVGYLQRNKVRKALKLFEVIQSVDRKSLVEAIARRAVRPVKCLIEVNTSGEPQKHGIYPDGLPALMEFVLESGVLKPLGLMTVGPYPPNPERSKCAFRLLRKLRDALQREFQIELPILSMGMSEDFQWAIEEGATMLRIGRAIFGERLDAKEAIRLSQTPTK